MTPEELIQQAKEEARLLKVGMVVYLRSVRPYQEFVGGITPITPLRVKSLRGIHAIVGRVDGQPILLSGIPSHNIQTLAANLRLTPPFDSTSPKKLQSSPTSFRRRNMARGRKVNLQDVTDMVSTAKSKKEPEWYQYVGEISSLGDYPDALEYDPDEGESLRKLRVRVTKAANSQEIEITHRETARGTLIVYRPPAEGTRRGGRRKRTGNGAPE
jgi:hypothetical protein